MDSIEERIRLERRAIAAWIATGPCMCNPTRTLPEEHPSPGCPASYIPTILNGYAYHRYIIEGESPKRKAWLDACTKGAS